MLALTACTSHFITDEEYRGIVADDFQSRSAIMQAAGIDLASMGLNQKEEEALEFLYAYMPLGDIVNNAPEYYQIGRAHV